MQLDLIPTPERESLQDIEEALERMMVRRQAILSQPALTQQTLVELTAIFNNVAYVFLYLEANDDYINYGRVLRYQDDFYKNLELEQRTLDLLYALRCSDADAERSRRAYVEQLEEKRRSPDPAYELTIKQLQAEAKSVLDNVRQDQARLLARIGLSRPLSNPSAAFYKLASNTASATSRSKLARTWTAVRDANCAKLVGLVDQMIDTRRHAAAECHDSVIARTLRKCSVSEADIAAFLDQYLACALNGHSLLESEIRHATSNPETPLEHFGFYIRTTLGDAKTPLFLLDDCLDYIFVVARAVFGLVLRRIRTGSAQMSVGVWADGVEEVGRINFDLWDTEAKTGGANHTKGIRNRSDWEGLMQRPVAHVSCRFMRGADGATRITFQNVHSLFHEFGHAINHLLIREQIPNQSGLEYLPLERLEFLSMWFEKWAYHPAFGVHLGLSDEEHEGLLLCQRVKMLEYRRTYVERAVTACLDFDLHRRTDGGMEASFRRLDQRFGIARFCTLGDFPAYFTWPMFHANPGANFVYLWGAAAACQVFRPFLHDSLDEIARRPGMRDLLAPCFHFDLPADMPDSEAVFAFYAHHSEHA